MNAPLWEQQELNKAHKRQERDTEAFRDTGVRVPEPVLGQSDLEYGQESCRMFKRTFLPQNHELYKVNYRGLKTVETLDPFEAQLVPACVQQATDPNCVARTVDPGELREIKTRNPYTNQVDAIRFVGHWNDASESQDSFVKDQGYGHRPGRRVRIRNPTDDPGWFPKEYPSVWMSGRVVAA
jgi:hypothetical protein